MTARISDTIRILRFPLIALVMFIHTPRVADGPECYRIITSFFSSRLAGVAVPLFFAISGYLFFVCGFSKDVFIAKLKRRVKSLLIPYLLWNIIALVLLAVPHVKSYEFTFGNVLISLWDCNYSFVHAASHSPIDFPLWYVRDLMVCNLAAPVVYWGIKYLEWTLPAALVALWICGVECPIAGISVISFAFYSLGAYMAINRSSAIDERKGMWCVIGFAIFMIINALLAVWPSAFGMKFIDRCVALLGVICIPSFVCWLLDKNVNTGRVLKKLAPASFFIYAAHAIFLKNIYWTLLKVEFLNEISAYFLTYFITMGICLVAYFTFDRMCPKMSEVLNGR